MNDTFSRRNFLSQSAGAGLLAPLALSAASTKGPAGSLGEVKMALFSITYMGFWYNGDALSMEQMIPRAKAYGYEAIEIQGKRPHGCPLDWPKSRCLQYRKQVEDAGLTISGVAADNDFSSAFEERRECELANVRDQIRMTADLNAKVLRVFLAWAGSSKTPTGGGRYDLAQKAWQFAHDQFTDEQAWDWSRKSLIEAAKYAGDAGVTLALQNHKPMIKNYHELLRMVQEVNSPHVKVSLDAPIMESRDAAYLRKAVYDVGALQVQTHFGGDFAQSAPGAPIQIRSIKSSWGGQYIYEGFDKDDIYTPFIQALLETGYRGYIGYELCHPLPIVNGKTVGIEYVDASTKLAAQYMKGIVADARKRAMANRPSA